MELLSPDLVLVALCGYGLFRVWVLTGGIMSLLPTVILKDAQKIPDFLRFLICITERYGKEYQDCIYN